MAKLNPIHFSTQYADDVTGDVKYLFRDYGASEGTWRSRDPYGERGNGDPLEEMQELNLYTIVKNDLLSGVDRLGLLTFSSGCTEKQKLRIKEAFDKACSKAKSCWHRFCLNNRFLSREMRDTCDRNKLHVVCHPKATRLNECKSLIRGEERCGITSRGARFQPWHTIHLCPGAFDDPGSCGELACTVLHEMTHAARTGSEEIAQRSEICSGMDCVTDPDIKIRDMSKAPAHVGPCWCGNND
jgi:RHS repeat-associated protein